MSTKIAGLARYLARRQRFIPRSIVWVVFFSWWDRLARIGAVRADPPPRVLFVRVDLLGDLALQAPWLGAMAAVADDRGWAVDLLCNQAASRVLQPLLPASVRLIPVDRNGFVTRPWYRLRVLRQLCRTRYASLVQLGWSRDLLWLDALAAIVPADEKIALESDLRNQSSFQRLLGDLFYTRKVVVPPDAVFHGNANRVLAEAVIAQWTGTATARPTVMTGVAGGKDDNLSPHTIFKDHYYLIFPGASTATKRWPAERFAELIDRLGEYTSWQPVLAGAPTETEIAHRIVQSASTKVTNLAGRIPPDALMRWIQRAQCLIGNDSGPAHLGALAGTPVVAVVGGGDFGRFFPYPKDYSPLRDTVVTAYRALPCYGCQWTCSHPERRNGTAFPCIDQITVQQVLDAVKTIIPADGNAGPRPIQDGIR